MLTVTLVLVLAAFVATVVAAMGKCPLWVGVLLVALAQLLAILPAK